MAGHSRWSQIKRHKALMDARRGQLFTKLVREIMVAVRQGGGNPDTNPRLRLAIQKAKDNNMPAENIERAIKKALGQDDEVKKLEEVFYEGYGPGGIAILLHVLTDNRKRTSSLLRHLFTTNGGNLGESGCVSWLFEQKGVILVDASDSDPEEVALKAIDAGAEDVKLDEGSVEIHTKPEDLEKVRAELAAQGVKIISAELSMLPKTTLQVEEKVAPQALRLLEELEKLEEVQQVFTNAEFPNKVLESSSR